MLEMFTMNIQTEQTRLQCPLPAPLYSQLNQFHFILQLIIKLKSSFYFSLERERERQRDEKESLIPHRWLLIKFDY